MQDVAVTAGVTKITVSRYLREPSKVAPETAERIRQAMAEHAYVPNKSAGLLASGRSRVVAAIVPSIANSVFAETVQGLSDGLQPAGLELLLACSGYSPAREEEQIRAVLGWSPDALVVTGRHHSEGALALLRQAVSAGTPIVEMWDRRSRAEFLQVGFDHAEVGAAMAEHLLQRGHRRLVYVDTGVAADFRAHERGQAFVRAAAAAGVGVRVHTAPQGDPVDAGRAALVALVATAGPVDAAHPLALAFANDHLACGAWLEAERRGLAVPSALALLGFGDFTLSRQLGGGISTVQPARYEIGSEAAALVLRTLRREPGDPAQRSPGPVRWLLVARGSTGDTR
jgi:LacI family gluconate utilization system Gnt-I transcriptional repressor